MKNMKGFTLVELVIVIVIVGILSVVAVPVYKGYTKKAMATEGKALLGAVNTSQKVYFAEYAVYTNNTAVVDVDPAANKYFTAFALSTGSGTFTATTAGKAATGASGITLTLTGSSSGESNIIESGL